jgi:hypothetical protein
VGHDAIPPAFRLVGAVGFTRRGVGVLTRPSTRMELLRMSLTTVVLILAAIALLVFIIRR